MDTRTLFETTARQWWPEIDLSRDAQGGYVTAATRWMYEGWVLSHNAEIKPRA